MKTSMIAFVLFFVCRICCGVGGTNYINRTIRYDGKKILVKDTLNLTQSYADRDKDLFALYLACSNKGVNVAQTISNLMRGEDLELHKYTFNRNGSRAEITIDSTLRIIDTAKPLIIHFVLTFGGTRAALEGDLPKQTNAQLLVCFASGKYFLVVPKLVRFDQDFAEMKKEGMTFDDFFNHGEPVEWECSLLTGDKLQTVLMWKPHVPSKDLLDTSTINQLDEMYKLSGNDQLLLFTSLKVAKPGYYAIMQCGNQDQR
jgi:hypothetical protein